MEEIEYLDLVDENDNIIGKEDRNIIYKNNWKNFRVINIMVFTKDNKIIVPKRSSNRKLFQNCYDCSAGGHVSSGEDYIDAAYRELEEELGITNVELEEIGYFNPYKVDVSAFSKLYKLEYDGELNFDKDGIQELCYMEKNQVENLIKENPLQFKGDYPILFKWLDDNKII